MGCSSSLAFFLGRISSLLHYRCDRRQYDDSIKYLLEPFSETETEGTSARSLVVRDEVGPSRQDYVVVNQSFESSMQNRILRLKQDDSSYLLGKANGMYWSDIRLQLEHASSQKEYNRLLEFENKDLHIRTSGGTGGGGGESGNGDSTGLGRALNA
ncbi:hypothetical protein Tco_0393341, partial [Tanacetum coccineum]